MSNLVDDSGNSVVSYEYSDFGITTIHGNTDFYNEICYTQAIFDASTGLYYMNARYYDPEDGRFLSQDTFRGTDTDPGTWNLYTYCANNPVKYVDPSGHFFKSITGLIKTAVKKIAPAVSAVKKTVSKTVAKVATKATATIEAGDLVLAADSETGEVAYKKVVQVFKNTTNELTHVTISNHNGVTETIDATPQHPFYVDGIGWVEASSLHEGMTVWFADGSKGTVADISNEGLAEQVAVYNFEVEDFHTYFVGTNGVLVHNSCTKAGDIGT